MGHSWLSGSTSCLYLSFSPTSWGPPLSHRVEPVRPLPALTLTLAAGDLCLGPSPTPTSSQPPAVWNRGSEAVGLVTTVGRGRVRPGGPGLKGTQVPIVTPTPTPPPRPASLEPS